MNYASDIDLVLVLADDIQTLSRCVGSMDTDISEFYHLSSDYMRAMFPASQPEHDVGVVSCYAGVLSILICARMLRHESVVRSGACER